MSTTLRSFLEERGYIVNFPLSALEGVLSASSARMPAFLLRGPAGAGKTEVTRLIAEWLGAHYIFYQCTLNSNEDDLLYKYVPAESTKSGIKILPSVLPQTLFSSRRRRVVLVLDEFDKTRPSADALLLDFLQNARVSARFKDEEVIVGNPRNIVVFLTSNDMREFSEPLIRRVTSLSFHPLRPAEVAKLLRSSGFTEELIKLLVQIYEDTHTAGLRKPATIQELQLLGGVMQKYPSEDLTRLLRAFVVKYDDDWEAYKQYVADRSPAALFNQEQFDAGAHYVNVQSREASAEEETKRTTVETILESLKVVQPPAAVTPQPAAEAEKVYLKAVDGERQAYTEVIKKLRPEPTDDPTKFGKYVVKLEGNGNPFVTASKPLTYEELTTLKVEGEGYAEFEVLYKPDVVKDKLLKEEASIVKYYTKNTLALQFRVNGGQTEVLIRYDLADNKIALYFRGRSSDVAELLERFNYKTTAWRFDFLQAEILKHKDLIRPEVPVRVVAGGEYAANLDLGAVSIRVKNSEEIPRQLFEAKTWRDVISVLSPEREEALKNGS